jgi:uncharacterized membrane protein required for colicin V production
MIIDLLILLPLIGFGALGYRDASARKLVAIAVCIIAMFVAQLLMHDVAGLLISLLHAQPASAPEAAYFWIFTMLLLLQAILYRFVAHNYRFGGIIDRIVGVVLGLAEGLLIISVIIFIMTMQGPPSRRTLWDTRLYHPVASIAPRTMDFFSNLLPSAEQSIEEMTSPGQGKVDSTLQAPQQ